MSARSNETDLGQAVSEVNGLATGLGVLSTTFFPFALPAVVMTLPLVVPLVVLALPALLVWLLVRAVRAVARRLTAARAGRATRAGTAVGRADVRPSA
jgi:hypothetical protein